MNREDLIRNLKYTMKKHENDRINTFGTDISMLCKDTLEVLEPQQVIYEGDGYADGKMVYDIARCPNCDYTYEADDPVTVKSASTLSKSGNISAAGNK